MNAKNKEQEILIANELIESRYNLALTEQKMINLLISKISLFDSDLQYYDLEKDELLRVFNTKDYKQRAIKALDNLEKSSITIKKNDGKMLKTTWLSSAEYDENSVEVEFSRKLKPFLIELKKCFTRYNLAPILKFKSKYSIRVYQLLKQYEKIGSRTFEIEDFQEIVGSDYEKYSDMRKKVIETAINEINNSQESDIKVSFSCQKVGRKVTTITFNVTKKIPNLVTQKEEKVTSKTAENKQISEDELFDMIDAVRDIISEKLSTVEIKTILKASNYDVDCVERNYVRSIEQANIRNLASYLVTACREDYEKNSSDISRKTKKKSTNKFHNFDEHDYDFDELNRAILEQQWAE